MSIIDEIKRSYHLGGVLTKFIYVNIGVFLVVRLLQIFFTLSGGPGTYYPIPEWLSVPSQPDALLIKPWTLITYMFVHYEFLHFLFNVLVLYWFGQLFLMFFSSRQFVGVYLLGGSSGAIAFIVFSNLLGWGGGILMGASASVMAVLFASAAYRPDFAVYLMFFGQVKLKYIALVYFILDLISISAFKNIGGHISHIGGAAFGWYFATRLLKGKDITAGFSRLVDRLGSLFHKRSKMKVTYKRPVSDFEYNAQKIKKQAELDRILEKIKRSGYDSLTKDEKKTLFEESKK
jgi:membrane associated rhomboid family serine protease